MPRHYTIEPTPAHTAYLDELKSCLGSTGKDLESDVLLAISAQFVGMLLALQDHRKYTPAMGMALINENIATGNQNAVAQVMGDPEGQA